MTLLSSVSAYIAGVMSGGEGCHQTENPYDAEWNAPQWVAWSNGWSDVNRIDGYDAIYLNPMLPYQEGVWAARTGQSPDKNPYDHKEFQLDWELGYNTYLG